MAAALLMAGCGDDGSGDRGMGPDGSGAPEAGQGSGPGFGGDPGTTFGDGGMFVEPDGALPTADGGADGGTNENCGTITAIIRDFKDSHPDFQAFMGTGATTGLVESMLGDGDKPVFADTHGSGQFGQQLTSESNFDQWYRDVSGVNERFEIEIELEPQPGGGSVYDNSSFFPIDGQGFGNEGREHNFHFTTEIHTKFTYEGGEQFTFRGDDDLWLFVNQTLALDLGGLHTPVEGTVDFDAQADELDIEQGNEYRMDIFHAERRTVMSNFRIETNIECLENAPLK